MSRTSWCGMFAKAAAGLGAIGATAVTIITANKASGIIKDSGEWLTNAVVNGLPLSFNGPGFDHPVDLTVSFQKNASDAIGESIAHYTLLATNITYAATCITCAVIALACIGGGYALASMCKPSTPNVAAADLAEREPLNTRNTRSRSDASDVTINIDANGAGKNTVADTGNASSSSPRL